ncbi:bifunctional 5,10-methylenetetrahydrofolate dehydrogenase/5,10-methenyltetrahydrofolate cyclohydrolase [Komarekiella sp. 'clone 1']|uniref:Bifunctional 5,10-methylenetetrahydrofolate dehydrogenase/5,10-methenyltetrahydrofolate cyclohydrolase n=1 Tax=Komarekiella delphini-convector SJRDD-AB1 TaxID=2593771 RepID=A0AA40VUZ7_9NOST|nr:bifunctional 5,10-methylenetetrahydrofolate dehydrogenase/5,10-methenyltetrahydrofolate cyclohydrolase [Komarekiella delphini-convector]MBD6620670.1 bifunctional 5,10-methylenetetrahydrofolate dehydrogenase/5,10-methenyltetrahydrofolate cyclohydrolase [Komarekiella delphini-convector SJRDD-AB1]
MTLIDGQLIREYVKQECQKYKPLFQASQKEVAIIRFESSENVSSHLKARYDAARISAEQKVATFNAIGVTSNHIVLSSNIAVEQFESIIQSINEDNQVAAAIVQYPIPIKFTNSIRLLEAHKDIDIVRGQSNNLFENCATAEGIARIVESYVQRDSNVAVVGGGGFVGNGVIKYLEASRISCFCLEDGDDLSRTEAADIVVSVTGRQGIFTPYVLPSHRLVVDGGFTPTASGVAGDVNRSAYRIPQNITPVPGGVGPIEMAILAERLVKMDLGVELGKWNYQQLQQSQLQRAVIIAPISKALFRQQATVYPQYIHQERENLFVLQGANYKVIYNKSVEILSIARIDEKLTLIRLNLANNQIETARGITDEDVTRWQQIQTLINPAKTQSPDRGIEL